MGVLFTSKLQVVSGCWLQIAGQLRQKYCKRLPPFCAKFAMLTLELKL